MILSDFNRIKIWRFRLTRYESTIPNEQFCIFESFILHKYQWSCCTVELLGHVQPFVTQWTAAQQASLSFSISQSLLKLM